MLKRILSVLVGAGLAVTMSSCASGENSTTSQASKNDEGTTAAVDGSETSEQGNDAGAFYTSSETTLPVGAVSVGDTFYAADSTGVWTISKGSGERHYINENSSSGIATDGNTILYVNVKYEADVADFYSHNAEIHSVGTDGSNDTVLVECTQSAQPFLIFENKLYYVDYATNESFHRELFAADLSSGEEESIARDVTYPKLFENKIYYTESGLLQDTEEGKQKIYDVAANSVSDYTDAPYSNLFGYCFHDGAVGKDMDGYFYKNGSENTEFSYNGAENTYPVFVFDEVVYCANNRTIEAVKSESPTEPNDETDYSSYVGQWEYTEIPEQNDEYTIPEDHYIKTTLIFRSIEGSTADFELTKGNVLYVADTHLTAEIVDGKIDFNYTDGFNGKGHGTITLNGDTVHVDCVEDEHGTGRIGLNCNEDLTKI